MADSESYLDMTVTRIETRHVDCVKLSIAAAVRAHLLREAVLNN